MEATSTTSSAASSVDGRSVGAGSGSDYLNLGMFAAGGGSGSGQQLGDLLVGGAGGFSSSLGNGFGNDSSGANAGAGSAPSSGTSFDLSDFPSLGGSGNAQAPGSGNNGLAAALRQQQQLLAHQQMLQGSAAGGNKTSNLYRLAMTGTNGNFNMATEDFPALSAGAPAGGAGGSSQLSSSSLLDGSTNSGVVQRSQSNGSVGGLYGSEMESSSSQLDGGAGLLGGAGLGGLGGLRGLQQSTGGQGSSMTRTPAAPSAGAIGNPSSGSGSGSGAGSALSGDYGLLGLLGVIRMSDADRNALALGSDLTMLGLNLGTTEQIYSTFSSPFSDNVASKEPHYQLPMCYYMQPPALKTGHLSKFQLETLFYIFYALPKDVLQAYAAQELYSREWRYHGDLKLWFKRAGPSDGVSTPSSGSPQYLYFDINSCERRLFNGNIQNLTSGFLPEDDVRVKFPSS